MTREGLLAPYRVLDLTDERGQLGPMLLGDLGADVIRIEPPSGSAARRSGIAIDAADGNAGSADTLDFLAYNRNKRSIVLDESVAADRETLLALVNRADIVVESTGELARYGLTHEALCDAQPRIVHVVVSAFGSEDPYRQMLGNDLVIAAMGGPVSLQGSPDRAPLRISVPQVWRHAGAEAAAAAMAGHARMLRTGRAQRVDLSAQSCMTWTMLQAMDAHAIQGADFERNDSYMNNARVAIQLVHPCKDGHLVALPLSKVVTGCMDAMLAAEIVDPTFADVDWAAWDLAIMEPDPSPCTLEEMTVILRRFFALHTKAELLSFGLERGISLAPILNLRELQALEHLHTRDYWRELRLSNGAATPLRTPGLWAKMTGPALTVRHAAPSLDEHGEEIRRELATPLTAQDYPEPDGELPFAGLRVADFSWVGVGPISAKFLADHGADVVRVESLTRPDVLRGGGPFKDGIQDINRSQFFGDFNTSKRGLALDMKLADARTLARELIKRSDVMIESMAPGAIARMGLDYAQVRELNPNIIMISTCLMGQTGPARGLAGYGYHAAALAGFYEVTGWPDRAPSGPWTAYTDTIAPRFISTLLTAALDHRRRTGEGCHIDLAQIETALHFLTPELLDEQLTGRSATRMGNRLPGCAPQGCYPCSGEDQWLAIGIDTDDQWSRLVAATDGALRDWENADTATRMANHDAIDAALSGWTSERSRASATESLQRAGVPAGPVQRSSDLLVDPQYQERRFYRYYEHQEMGHIPYAGHQYRISDYDNGPRGPAPALGQHSFEILSELLGLDDEAIAEAYASGAIN